MFQCIQHGSLDFRDRLLDTMSYLLVRNGDFHRQRRHTIRTMYDIIFGRIIQFGQSRTHIDFDQFGRTFSHFHIMLTPHILLYVVRQIVTGYPYRIVRHDTTQRNNGNFGRTTTDIHNHISLGSLNVKSYTYRGSHRLINHIYISSSGMLRRVAHRTNFNLGTSRRNTYYHTQRRREPMTFGANHLYHTSNHLLGSIEVGYHTVSQRSDRAYIFMGFTMHQTSFFTDRQQLVRTFIQRNHRRFVHHDFIVVDNHRIGCAQVYGNLLCERKQSHIGY